MSARLSLREGQLKISVFPGIGFADEHTAFEMRAELAILQKEYLIDMEDVVVVTKDEKGKVKLHMKDDKIYKNKI